MTNTFTFPFSQVYNKTNQIFNLFSSGRGVTGVDSKFKSTFMLVTEFIKKKVIGTSCFIQKEYPFYTSYIL